MKQIYEKRLNTHKPLCEAWYFERRSCRGYEKLAKDKMLRALSNVAYAKGDYEKEMGQAA